MRGPNLRKLVRSLRTKSYEKLSIQKYLSPIPPGEEGAAGGISSEQESTDRKKSYREIEPD
jgi:hypothetical protein